MSKRYEFWIGRRYVRSRSSNSFISLISGISMLGIAIAVAVLIVVMSVVNGFERELQDRLLTMTSHVSLLGLNGRLADSDELIEVAERNADVRAAAPFVSGQALLVVGRELSGIELRGIDPVQEAAVSGVANVMQTGTLVDLSPGDFNIVLGRELADALAVTVGEKVTVTLAQGIVSPAGVVPRMKRFTVSGIYRVGMYEFDRRLAFVNIADAQKLYRLRDNVSGVRLAVNDVFLAPEIARDVALTFGRQLIRDDWMRGHVNFFRSIQITKSILFIILLLLVAVAAFNIVSTLVMVVKDKQSDIAILRTIGAEPSGIVRIFMTQGCVVGLVGTLVGVLLGIVISLNLESIIAFLEATLGIKFLAADVYFISDLPSELQYGDVLRIALIALALALISTLYPAWMAARTAPAEALRYD